MRKPFIAGLAVFLATLARSSTGAPINDSSPLHAKAEYFRRDLIDKHSLDGLYVSIVPAAPAGTVVPHTVDQPGNVIHAGVWTGRYLAGVGYHYAVTRDSAVRKEGGQILRALRVLQEVTGKPGLLARGYIKGHGPVQDWERDGQDSAEWHQGQGAYADYRWYGDVSVDNFNAVLYGYAIYYDLAADSTQRQFIAHDVNRLMAHLLDNNCRIIDVDGEVTRWGHVGIDPDPARDSYYRTTYSSFMRRTNSTNEDWHPPLRSSLMLLPDLLIAHHITGDKRYSDFYNRVVDRFKNNPDQRRDAGPFTLERLARVNHSSEGQAYEALYNLIRYESNPDLLQRYQQWTSELWEINWMEGNTLFTWMTRALLPRYRAPRKPGLAAAKPDDLPHGEEATALSMTTLRLFPIDRVFRPVMNSARKDIERNPFSRNETLSAKPVPINERPLDNEYAWKGNPYQLDGWFKPTVTQWQASCDDPKVLWFSDSNGRIFRTLDGGASWQDMSQALRGARIKNFDASKTRTFVLYAETDQGVFVTRDGGLSWRPALASESPAFTVSPLGEWKTNLTNLWAKIDDAGQVIVSHDQGRTSMARMQGWRIPKANSIFVSAQAIIASGPGGTYQTRDGLTWTELKLWREEETGAADFLHAYWMGRYYGFINGNE